MKTLNTNLIQMGSNRPCLVEILVGHQFLTTPTKIRENNPLNNLADDFGITFDMGSDYKHKRIGEGVIGETIIERK